MLRDTDAFLQSDFQPLYANDAQVLGGALISKRELVVPPGANIPVRDEVPLEASALGVFVAFRSYDLGLWRAEISLEPGRVNDVQANLAGVSVNILSVLVGSRPLL